MKKLVGVMFLLWMETMLVGAFAVAFLPRPSPDDASMRTVVVAVAIAIFIAQILWLGGKTGDRFIHSFKLLSKGARAYIATASALLFLVPASYFFWAV